MQQVNVFIETSSRFRGNVERKCGYVLSTQLRTGKETREHFGRVTGTYHQAILLTMVDALDHMTRTCDVCFYMGNVKRSDNVQINQQPRPWIGLVQS